MSTEKNTIDSTLAAGTAIAGMNQYNGIPYLVVPEGYCVEEFERFLARPSRHRGRVQIDDADSFIRYIKDFDGDKFLSPRLYFQQDPRPVFIAVMNDANANLQAWGDFTVTYNAPLSKEWQAWTEADGKPMTQENFALFIERNLLDIYDPEPASLLELAQTFQAKKSVNFASGTRLNNGQVQFVFEETIQAKAGEKGQINVPDSISIVIPVFDGSKVGDRINAKFRYRIRDAKLLMWFELERPHKVLETAVEDLRKQIEEGTGLSAFKGSPRSNY